MTIIVFLIDTSASMNQRVYSFGRPTLLDVAKGCVETFVKIRQRSPDSKGDRYMLLTFEDYPNHIKAGWKENLQTFTHELKNLQALGMTNLGTAIKNTFDILNLNRMQTGIDMYGQGRCPFFLEPSVVVCITDSGKLTGPGLAVMDELKIPRESRVPGSELTRDSFRWDQRFFGLVLRMPATPADHAMMLQHQQPVVAPCNMPGLVSCGLVDSDTGTIDRLCEITGGRSYAVTSQRVLLQCVESLVQKIQSGVVVHFEKIGPDPAQITAESDDVICCDGKENSHLSNNINNNNNMLNNSTSSLMDGSRPGSPVTSVSGQVVSQTDIVQSWYSCRKLIYVPRSGQKGFPLGHWPIPESFWPDITSPALPGRTAHPHVRFSCIAREPIVVDNIPFDKYELEPSPLTQYILSRKQPTVCWQVYVMNSCKSGGLGEPFGYLKASSGLSCVNLFVMPYNYPVLLPLLDELLKLHRLKPTKDWKSRFDSCMRTMPGYYAQPLRQALKRMGAPSLVPDNMDNGLSLNVINNLKRLKSQAKLDYDRLCAQLAGRQQQHAINEQLAMGGSVPPAVVAVRINTRPSDTRRPAVTNPALTEKFVTLSDQMNDMASISLTVQRRRCWRRRSKHHHHRHYHIQLETERGGDTTAAHSYRNPFDVQRSCLLDQLVRMRANLLQSNTTRIQLHDQDQLHSMPVSQMGNYQDYLKKMTPPLRELESQPVRQHMFGNPFKIDKRMMVDEADIDLLEKSPRGGATGTSSSGAGSSSRRDSSSSARARHLRRSSATPPPPSPSPLSSSTAAAPQQAARRPAQVIPDKPAPVNPPITVTPPVAEMSPAVLSNHCDPAAALVSSVVCVSDQQMAPLSPVFAGLEANCADRDNGTGLVLNSPATSVAAAAEISPEQPTIVSLHELEDDAELSEISVPLSGGLSASNVSLSPHSLTPTLEPARTGSPPLVNGTVLVPPVPRDPHRDRLLRQQLYRLIRRPGRDYSDIMAAVRQCSDDEETRRQLLHDVIAEASRLKRRHLIVQLQLQLWPTGGSSSNGVLNGPR